MPTWVRWKSKKVIKSVVTFLKEYDVMGKSWVEIMKDEEIPIEIRNFINGSRYIFTKEMIDKITKKDPELLFIYATGSERLTSDKDIQISLDINGFDDPELLNKIIDRITTLLHKGNKLWKTENIEHLLDIHFYPPTLLNFISGKSKSNKYIRLGRRRVEGHKLCIFMPQVGNQQLIKEFHKKELKALSKPVKEDTGKFYTQFKKKVADCLSDVIDCYQKDITLTDQQFNDRLHCLVQLNNIGPEMYLTISSIILVVWHLQMKNHLSKKHLQVFAPIAYKENKRMYQHSKNPKYKARYQYCEKYM